MKILLTGFNPFGTVKINPSQLVVETLAQRPARPLGADLVTEILPTAYIEAGDRITHLIRHHRPDSIICLGVAEGTPAIRLERVALNLDDAELPDNTGLLRQGSPIVLDGPAAYWSTLPLEQMRRALARQGIPAAISNHAGTYLCNHVFYRARHEVEQLRLPSPCGFIHLPALLEPAAGRVPPAPGLPLAVMLEAIDCCLNFAF